MAKYQMRILTSAKLAEKSTSFVRPSKGRTCDMAFAAGFWVVCSPEEDSENDGSIKHLNSGLKDQLKYADEFGTPITLPMKLKDLVVAESKYSRSFLDIQARPMYIIMPRQNIPDLKSIQGEQLHDILSSAIALSDKNEKGTDADTKKNGGMDKSAQKDNFEEIKIDVNMFSNPLHFKLFKMSSTFTALWERSKVFAILTDRNKENQTQARQGVKLAQHVEEKKGFGKGGKSKGHSRGEVRRLPDRQSGTCKWFNTIKGYGFILPEEGTDDIFVHQTAIKAIGFRSLAEGERVEFDVEVDANGRKKARNVTGPNGDYVRGAPFVHPYMVRPRGGYMASGGYGRGGWGRGGVTEEMHGGYMQGQGGGYYRGGGRRGRGTSAARVEYPSGGNGQMEYHSGRGGGYTYQGYGGGYQEYGGNYQQVYGNYSTSQGYMVQPQMQQQQPRNPASMISQQMQGLSLQGMGVRSNMGGPAPLANSQQLYGYPQMMTSQGNEGRMGSGRGRGALVGYKSPQSKDPNKSA
mmetsp:Transcript_15918/g.25196  ORF Transcript_15918/g.25196 Transcript_15918/m.25196 type:complete len:520 (+) Transcript_15918:228-1787(+)